MVGPRPQLTLDPDFVRVQNAATGEDTTLSAKLAIHVGRDRIPKIIAVGDEADEAIEDTRTNGCEHEGHVARGIAPEQARWLAALERHGRRVAKSHVGEVVLLDPVSVGSGAPAFWTSIVHYAVWTTRWKNHRWWHVHPPITAGLSSGWSDQRCAQVALSSVWTPAWRFADGSAFELASVSNRWIRRTARSLEYGSLAVWVGAFCACVAEAAASARLTAMAIRRRANP